MKDFRTHTEIVAESKKVGSDCVDIAFFNTGSEMATVDGIPVAPGASYAVSGNYGERNVTQYSVVFAGGGIPAIAVIRKIYV